MHLIIIDDISEPVDNATYSTTVEIEELFDRIRHSGGTISVFSTKVQDDFITDFIQEADDA